MLREPNLPRKTDRSKQTRPTQEKRLRDGGERETIKTRNLKHYVLTKKDQEIFEEMKYNSIDSCWSETKKKGEGKVEVDHYIMMYSSVPWEERACSEVGLLVHQKFKLHMPTEEYLNDRILPVTIELNR